jgi:hypothetical protein
MTNQQLKINITLQTLIWGLKNNPETKKDSKGNLLLITHQMGTEEGWEEREEISLSKEKTGEYTLRAGKRDLISNTFMPEYCINIPQGSMTYVLNN